MTAFAPLGAPSPVLRTADAGGFSVPVLYEDNHLLVVVKPAGLPCQADESGDLDLLTLLKQDVKRRYAKPGAVYLGLVHRLDRPVSGVMAFARTSKAAARLSAGIQADKLDKTYLAVVEGAPFGGRLEHDLVKDPRTHSSRAVPPGTAGAKHAVLEYQPLCTAGQRTLVQVQLRTGRSHQIRVQFAAIGCPLWGDARYNPGARPGQDIALFAARLGLEHPTRHVPMCWAARPAGAPWTDFVEVLP